ncbi:MAG: hypothetical protein JWM99_1516 [Verrucomicrobiales bacterium]|nr:hypothetical protein [Verrucomicrobiales bacterium]
MIILVRVFIFLILFLKAVQSVGGFFRRWSVRSLEQPSSSSSQRGKGFLQVFLTMEKINERTGFGRATLFSVRKRRVEARGRARGRARGVHSALGVIGGNFSFLLRMRPGITVLV